MPSLNDIQNASVNADLRARFEIAATEILGAHGPDAAAKQVVWDNFAGLVSHRTTVNGESTTVADILAYGDAKRAQALANVPPPAGTDPTLVTDDLIRQVITERFTKSTEG